ncbi:hypothetical protein [Streptomyces xanthophaeus]|uniref:Uncharacterized protein n=1 Tax=Streptomyces xanthophaeus TaxID=67385 RepID=A0A919LAS0_9ACTN|nr:hypothetical protein [Streptomyces xanthophaeus]GHI82985.1 hypothetical protein Sxan_03490 [Streptomyces xanthophaeus]
MSTQPQSGPGNPQQPEGLQPPQKQGMSTRLKIALGCGIPTLLGVIMIGGCSALFTKAANDVGKELDKNHDSAAVAPGGSVQAGGARKDGEADITKDVRVTSCKVKTGEYGITELDVRIEYVNSGDRRFTYLAEGEVTVNGEKKSDLLSTGQNLAPGQKYTDDDAGALAYDVAKTARPADKIECKLIKVSRNSF